MIVFIFLLLDICFGSDADLLLRHIYQKVYLKNTHQNLTRLRIQQRDLDQAICEERWKEKFFEPRIRVRLEQRFLIPKLINIYNLKKEIEVQQKDLRTFLQIREDKRVNAFVDKLRAYNWLIDAIGEYAPEIIEKEAT